MPDEREWSSHLKLLVDRVQELHDAWAADQETPYMTEAFAEVVDELIEVFASGSIPADCRELNQRVEMFAEQWNAWKTRAEVDPHRNREPGDNCWAAYEDVIAARRDATPKRPKTLESVAEFTATKVPDRQICLNYEWFTSDGGPDYDKLREERAHPGTHTGKGFVPPLERRRRDKEQRQDQILERARQQRAEKLQQIRSDNAPEDFSKLVMDEVSAAQIAGMKQMTVEEVWQKCDELELERPPRTYADPHTERGAFEPELPEEVNRAMDAEQARPTRQVDQQEAAAPVAQPAPGQPELTQEQQIVQLHLQGSKDGEIATALSTEDQQISRQKVSAVLGRYEQDPATFRMPEVGV